MSEPHVVCDVETMTFQMEIDRQPSGAWIAEVVGIEGAIACADTPGEAAGLAVEAMLAIPEGEEQ